MGIEAPTPEADIVGRHLFVVAQDLQAFTKLVLQKSFRNLCKADNPPRPGLSVKTSPGQKNLAKQGEEHCSKSITALHKNNF